VTADESDDAGAAFDRAAARAARREDAGVANGFQWINEHRYRVAVGRLVLLVVLLAAHVVAVRAVTAWLIAHLVVIAVLTSHVARRRLARQDAGPLPG
jgi:Flp pilus assembly protein TadB